MKYALIVFSCDKIRSYAILSISCTQALASGRLLTKGDEGVRLSLILCCEEYCSDLYPA